MKKLLFALFILTELSYAGACKLAILAFLGIYRTEFRKTTPVPKKGVYLKPGYHASPQLRLATLDPAYSKTVLRYGPGVYLYVNPEHAKRHATSINKGQIKKDRNPHPAVVYEGWVDVTNVFDTQRTYARQELGFILQHLAPENLARLEIEQQTFPMSGEVFYTLLSGAFLKDEPLGDAALSTVPTKDTWHREKAREVLLKAGINTILGVIPDPDTGEWHPAYISLVPITVK